VNFNLI